MTEPLVPADVDLPSTRADAISRATVRYFSGKPCPAGHKADRYTLNGYCVACQLAATRSGRARAKEKRGAP